VSTFHANGICTGYGGRRVIDGLSFSMESGRVMGILGANGSGKTTLIKSICGILRHEGECVLDSVKLEGLSARQLAQQCSYIPQRSGISIDISVLDVVLMGFNPQLGLLEHPSRAMKEQALESLEKAGLGGMADRNYMHLSEGQKQLCILARTLVAGSRLLLLDEPESALDFRYRYRMLEILRSWVREKHIGAITTLHDPGLALNYCDRILLVQEGKVLGSISPKEDPPDRMEAMLRRIYGPVSLAGIQNRSGRTQLVMLKEDDL